MIDNRLSNLLRKEMTRKDFLGFTALTVASLFGAFGVITELLSHAATPYASDEAENGNLTTGAAITNDNIASDGKVVSFGKSNVVPLQSAVMNITSASATLTIALSGVETGNPLTLVGTSFTAILAQ
jgi:hypothetical protein